MTTEEMIEELTQFYEAAGFADFYERELKGKSDEEIAVIYEEYREQNGEKAD